MTAAIHILHVDDDSEFADMVATFLEREADRITVTTATNPDTAMERLTAEPVDCLVSDYETHGQNGIEFLERVRATYPDLPFILFTGKGSEGVASDAISAGVTDCFQKSSGTEQYQLLAKRILDAVEHRQAKTNYREIFGKAPAIVIHDAKTGEIIDLNTRCAELFGYEREELLVAGFDAVLPEERPHTPAAARERIREAHQEEPRTFDWPGVTRGEDRFWAEVHLACGCRGNERVQVRTYDRSSVAG